MILRNNHSVISTLLAGQQDRKTPKHAKWNCIGLEGLIVVRRMAILIVLLLQQVFDPRSSDLRFGVVQ